MTTEGFDPFRDLTTDQLDSAAHWAVGALLAAITDDQLRWAADFACRNDRQDDHRPRALAYWVHDEAERRARHR